MQTQEKFWRVASSPHIHSGKNTRRIMLDVVVALLPAGVCGAIHFGWNAALLILVSVLSAVAWEAACQKLMKRKITVSDLSAVVTGLLVGYNLPATAPVWLAVAGTGLAIVLVKQCFGGLGQNFVNPALAARAILMASWPTRMSGRAFVTDAVSAATPLASSEAYSLWRMFIGDIPGCVGETCKLALLVGAAYLLIRGVIRWRIPAAMLGTCAVLFWIYSGSLYEGVDSALYQLLAGGLILCAFFMATDYATSPVTPVGQIAMGAGAGLLVFIFRAFNTSYPEGCSYAVLVMNLAVPLIDRWTKPRVYGKGAKRRA